MNWIIPFTTAEHPRLDQVGGKGLALITMSREGLAVPPGFVLSVAFFEPWMAALRSTPAWDCVQTCPAEELGAAARELQALSRGMTFEAHQRQELIAALQNLQASSGAALFAVRSSSPEEDLEGASFAGGYETSLGVTSAGLEAAVLHSFASSFDERVFLYKKEHGFSISQPRIAVVVQQQVDAECAGVAFSLNPLNNCYDEAVINANHGLGESVVSGDADPDVFVVDKVRRQIVEMRVGSKQTVITLNQNGGTTRTTSGQPQAASITSEQALDLTAMLEKVEAYYRKPVDIEWAITQGKLYLLQARPITTYLPLPEEMITPPGAPKRLYANSTLIEQGLQEPLSVLGTDFLGWVLNKVGGPVAEGAVGLDGVTFTAGGGYYMNISYGQMMGMKNASLAPGSFGDPRVLAILDSIDMPQYLKGELPPRLKAMRRGMALKVLPMIQGVLAAYLWPEKILLSYQAALPEELRRFDRVPTQGVPLQEQARQLTDLLKFFYSDYGIPMILVAQLAQQRIKGLFKAEAAGVQDHLINLGVALPGNKTTEMGEWIYTLALSDDIRRQVTTEGFLADLEAKRLSPEFMQLWDRFMAEFGHRSPGEIDVATPRTREQPARLFEQLKSMSQAAQSNTHFFFEEARAKREAAYQALLAIAQKKGRRQARAFQKYYQTWIMFGGYRETPKHYVIKVIDLFRQRALSLGQRFTAAGRLDRAEQIFDLTIADIDRATADPSVDLRALAEQRSALIQKIRKSRLVARIIDSRGKIFFPPPPPVDDGSMIGVPISPGVVRGRVKVMRHATEKKLLPGEILVARATDPGWTPLFINARGIILEIGGALQHGAVVAREYGIPCVSGLEDATSRLIDGQLVEVDGSNGVVRLLENEMDQL